MRIKLSVKPLRLNREIEKDAEFPKLDAASPLAQLMAALGKAMAKHPDLQSLHGMLPTEAYPDIEFPAADATIPVDILLCANHEAIGIALCSDAHRDHLGVFATSAGAIEPDEMYATRLRVLVACDEDVLRQHLAEERATSFDPYSSGEDALHLSAFLNTLTHELAHAAWFIEHGNGLSPADIDDLCDSGDLEFDISDTCNGRGIRDGIDAELSREDADFIMEERVEEQGREWLQWALQRVDPGLVSACLEAYAPSDMDMTCMREYG